MSVPVQKSQVNQFIESVDINIYKVVLNQGLRCVVYGYNSEHKQVDTFDIVVEGDEYESWTNDDDLKLLILSKCGLTPVVVV
jgi:hypothetical protein